MFKLAADLGIGRVEGSFPGTRAEPYRLHLTPEQLKPSVRRHLGLEMDMGQPAGMARQTDCPQMQGTGKRAALQAEPKRETDKKLRLPPAVAKDAAAARLQEPESAEPSPGSVTGRGRPRERAAAQAELNQGPAKKLKNPHAAGKKAAAKQLQEPADSLGVVKRRVRARAASAAGAVCRRPAAGHLNEPAEQALAEDQKETA